MVNSTFKDNSMSSHPGESPIPLYLRVADTVRERITKGIWAAGTRIPSLEDLGAEFGVARVTARQAVQLLTREGLLSPRRGVGTVVVETDAAPKTVVMQSSLSSLAAMYESTTAEMLTFDESSRMPNVLPGSGKLGGTYVFMRRLHFTEKQPYATIALYLLHDIFQRSPDIFRSQAVIPALLRTKGVKIDEARQTMTIGAADAETARLLRIRPGSPVAHVTRIFRDKKGVIIYYAEATYRGDWVRWEIDLEP